MKDDIWDKFDFFKKKDDHGEKQRGYRYFYYRAEEILKIFC